jgi:5-methylthioadenosine/S-adenosylhomocysteine deaminase
MEAVDTLISARWVIPIEPATGVLDFSARERGDRPDHFLLPGFVNAYADIGMPVPTTMHDTPPLGPWLDPERIRDTMELAMLRMAASGTTTFAAASLFPQIAARTAAEVHLRACVGLPVLEQQTGWASTVDEYLEKAAALHDDYSEDPLITTAFATGATLQRLRRAADEIELPILVPLHEHADAVAESIRRFGSRPIERLEHLGLATPQLVGLHATQLIATDFDLLARAGIQVIACPRTSLRGAGAPCSIVGLDHRGINAGLGTGDRKDLDLQGELRVASLLGDRDSSIGPALSPLHALRMATLGGARALGLAETTGSLVPGKWADLCCIDLSPLRTQPVRDVATQLVRDAGTDQVSDVWVAGRALMLAGNFVRLDPKATLQRASRWPA